MSITPPPLPPEGPATAAFGGSAADESPARSGTVVPFPRRADATVIPDAEGPTDEDDDGTADDTPGDHRDWAWVEEWRDGREPTPWAPGLAVAAFAMLVVGIAIVVLSDGLSGNPVVAVLVNLLVAAGLVPAIWLSRELPVLRWIGLGAAVGVVAGWITAIGMVG
ncbi:DUF2537 domain-containing protein [Nakamurella flava]|nr:DUF2537 domain-containing protein [Nakamurella flava]